MLRLLLTLIAISGVFTLDVYLPGSPGMASGLRVSVANIAYTFTAFSIVFALSQAVWGPVADRFGRRPILLIGLSLAVITTVLCALVVQYWQLLALRMIQAIGVSSFVVLNAIVRDVSDGSSATRWRAYLSSVSGASIALAPSLGGFAVHLFSWRGVFVVSAVILALTLLMVFYSYRETGQKTQHSFRKILDNYKQLFFKDALFRFYNLQVALVYSIHFCFVILSPFIIMEYFHETLLYYSIVMFAYGMCWLVSGIITSRLAYIFKNPTIIYIGCTVLLIGGVTLALLGLLGSYHTLSVTLTIFVIAVGAIIVRPTAITCALSSVPTHAAQGAAVINTTQFVVAGLLASFVGYFDHYTVDIIAAFAILFPILAMWLNVHASRCMQGSGDSE